MDSVKLVYSFLLILCGILIFLSYYRKGDERRKFIHEKAQSYSFLVMIGMLILHVAQSIFLTFQSNASYQGIGMSPLAFLSVISVIYLATLLLYRKKFGD